MHTVKKVNKVLYPFPVLLFLLLFSRYIFFRTCKLQAVKLLFMVRQQISASNPTQNTRSKYTQNTRLKLDWNQEVTTFTFTALIIFNRFILLLYQNLTKKIWNTKLVTLGKFFPDSDSYFSWNWSIFSFL